MSDSEPIPARPRWTTTGETSEGPLTGSFALSASVDPAPSATAGRVVLGVAAAAAAGSSTFDPTSDTVVAAEPHGPAEALARALAEAWARGDRPRAEDLLAERPELRDRPEALARLVREEVAQRRAAGLAIDPAEFLARFPGRGRDLLEWLDDGYPSRPIGPAATSAPAGAMLGEFVVVGPLGRGARGSVVLATQPALANRPVVIKATPREGWEHLSLARLQHPHIVPLLGVQEPADRDIRLLVMPYHGGAPLARVLELLADVPVASRHGRDLLDALDRADPSPPVDRVRAEGPARRFLARASYAKAVGWIGACLADALEEAHRRGLLHLDLKPSNVLLAADGRPMLLDFHLARGPIPAGAVGLGRVGGTPSYMAPEQRAALDAARDGRPAPRDVDTRADLFGLGALLHEALGGPVPLDRPPRRSWRRPGVDPGLAAIVRRCLADEPDTRYPDAGRLAVDLRRFLADLPPLDASRWSPREALRRWRSRRPLLVARAAIALLAVGLIAVVLGGLGVLARQRIGLARHALAESRVHLARRADLDAARDAAHGLALLDGVPDALGGPLRGDLAAQLLLARRARAAEDLHALADRLRPLDAADLAPNAASRTLADRCRALWARRTRLLPPLPAGEGQSRRLGQDPADPTATPDPRLQLAPDRERQLRDDLLDLATTWAALRARLDPGSRSARREALGVLDEAEALLGPQPAIDRQRRALDPKAVAKAEPRPPRSAREHDALGLTLLRDGDLEAALLEFDRALDLRPQDLWAHLHRGLACYRLGRFDEAADAFTACHALAPDRAEFLYDRALAFVALGRDDRAQHDLDRALRLDPRAPLALLNRGRLLLRAGQFDSARTDLLRALDAGADADVCHYDLALIARAAGDRPAALSHLGHALRANPSHRPSRDLARELGRPDEGGPTRTEMAND